MQPIIQEPTYPVVRFMLRHQRFIGPLAGLFPIVAAALWMWPQFNWPLLVSAIVVGAVVGLLLQSYVEVLRIISDTLLPR